MGQHHIGTAAVLLLTGVFAVCVLLVLLTGADSYGALAARDARAFDRRTCAHYVAEKVRQADAAGSVGTADFDGSASAGNGDTLFLRESVDGVPYETRVYWYGGYIRELYTQADALANPEDGEKILKARGLRFDLDARRGLLSAEITADDGEVTELALSLRSGKGAAS
ncbi:MAG: DUF4860 domain-containing protein [Oscillibacter sp.]|jgi:hypothetical protein|nr:DUF4860 domain-containing protein [Oscillibacter sp.]